MARSSWIDGIAKVKEKVRAVTPLPPEPKHEGEKQSMGFKITLGNDKWADACLIIGLIAVGFISCLVGGHFYGMWNDFQAQQFFSQQHETKVGRISQENAKAYSAGLYFACLGLSLLKEKEATALSTTLSQAKH